ncbi:MAG: TlpA family protein disulfide reductase [Treponema sp.]|jgi:peroxiredoxin|nr:TlpA family protein disulfide reductase [Treponema sp.]
MKYPVSVSSFLILPVLLIAASSLEAQAGDKVIPAQIGSAFSKAGIPVLRERSQSIDFSLPLLDGGALTLSSLKGKVVLLNFWATWCPPCRQEMPSMEALYRRFKDMGLAFLAVDIQESNRQVGGFMKDFGLTFPVALDASGSISNKYGIRGIPTTFVIDRDGGIIISAVGGRDWSNPAVVSAFEVLLQYGK